MFSVTRCWIGVNWLRLSQDRNKLCALLNAIIRLWLQEKYGKFLDRFAVSHRVLCCMKLTGGNEYDDFAQKRVPIKNGKKKISAELSSDALT